MSEPKHHRLKAETGAIGYLPAPAIKTIFPLECGGCGARNKYVIGVRPEGQTAEIVAIECTDCGKSFEIKGGWLANCTGKVNIRHSDRVN